MRPPCVRHLPCAANAATITGPASQSAARNGSVDKDLSISPPRRRASRRKPQSRFAIAAHGRNRRRGGPKRTARTEEEKIEPEREPERRSWERPAIWPAISGERCPASTKPRKSAERCRCQTQGDDVESPFLAVDTAWRKLITSFGAVNRFCARFARASRRSRQRAIRSSREEPYRDRILARARSAQSQCWRGLRCAREFFRAHRSMLATDSAADLPVAASAATSRCARAIFSQRKTRIARIARGERPGSDHSRAEASIANGRLR